MAEGLEYLKSTKRTPQFLNDPGGEYAKRSRKSQEEESSGDESIYFDAVPWPVPPGSVKAEVCFPGPNVGAEGFDYPGRYTFSAANSPARQETPQPSEPGSGRAGQANELNHCAKVSAENATGHPPEVVRSFVNPISTFTACKEALNYMYKNNQEYQATFPELAQYAENIDLQVKVISLNFQYRGQQSYFVPLACEAYVKQYYPIQVHALHKIMESHSQIMGLFQASAGKDLRVTSIASGPAPEFHAFHRLFSLQFELEYPRSIQLDLLDNCALWKKFAQFWQQEFFNLPPPEVQFSSSYGSLDLLQAQMPVPASVGRAKLIIFQSVFESLLIGIRQPQLGYLQQNLMAILAAANNHSFILFIEVQKKNYLERWINNIMDRIGTAVRIATRKDFICVDSADDKIDLGPFLRQEDAFTPLMGMKYMSILYQVERAQGHRRRP